MKGDSKPSMRSKHHQCVRLHSISSFPQNGERVKNNDGHSNNNNNNADSSILRGRTLEVKTSHLKSNKRCLSQSKPILEMNDSVSCISALSQSTNKYIFHLFGLVGNIGTQWRPVHELILLYQMGLNR